MTRPFPDDVEIRLIRNLYLPDIILAYNAVIVFMGSAVKTEYLLRSMELSTQVAAPRSDVLPCFIESRLLKDLVKSFALASKLMVIAGEVKGVKKSKGANGMDLWRIRPA